MIPCACKSIEHPCEKHIVIDINSKALWFVDGEKESLMYLSVETAQKLIHKLNEFIDNELRESDEQ